MLGSSVLLDRISHSFASSITIHLNLSEFNNLNTKFHLLLAKYFLRNFSLFSTPFSNKKFVSLRLSLLFTYSLSVCLFKRTKYSFKIDFEIG